MTEGHKRLASLKSNSAHITLMKQGIRVTEAIVHT